MTDQPAVLQDISDTWKNRDRGGPETPSEPEPAVAADPVKPQRAAKPAKAANPEA